MSSTKEKQVRKTGFMAPFALDQMISWVLQPIVYISFFILSAVYLEGFSLIAVLTVYSFLLVVVVACWMTVSSTNPADPTVPVRNYGLPLPQKSMRFCSVCNKNCPGLDHHCTWLNTCVAANNYGAFMWLLIAATTQAVFQTVVGIMMATTWYDNISENLTEAPSLTLFWVHNATAGLVSLAYGSLLSFHVYLMCIGLGTYDWLLRRKELRLNLKKSKATTVQSADLARPASPSYSNSDTPSSEKEQWKKEWLAKYGEQEATTSAGEVTIQITTPAVPTPEEEYVVVEPPTMTSDSASVTIQLDP